MIKSEIKEAILVLIDKIRIEADQYLEQYNNALAEGDQEEAGYLVKQYYDQLDAIQKLRKIA